MMFAEINKAIKDGVGFGVGLEYSDRFGDITISPSELIKLGKDTKLSTNDLVAKLADVISANLSGIVEKTEYKGGFFNLFLSDSAIIGELSKIDESVDSYISSSDTAGKTVVFDYSSPNIAKPFSVGHLRSTIIGQANLNCHKAIGYETVGINHIGDWGTQFGKLIVAIKKWGDEDEIEKDPIVNLNKIYVKFHREAENDPKLDDEARKWFVKLEQNDPEAKRLWEKCVTWSFVEFDELYQKLGIKIDHVLGESFYEKMLDSVVQELKDKNLLVKSEGALVVELEGMPPALIKKTDGATLYFTRDLAALKYRIEKYKPAKIVYHVGNDQSLHFRQLQEVAKKLGWLSETQIVFAGHGLLRLPEGKMSTREGRVILLSDLISQAVEKSTKIINEKNSKLNDKGEIAQKIAISAIKYSDLCQNRKSDIVFSFEKAITMEGNSGPYVQYSYARMASLIEKYKQSFSTSSPELALFEENRELAKLLMKTPAILYRASAGSVPSLVCEHAYKIANSFNGYYEKVRVVTDDKVQSSKNISIVITAIKILGKLFDVLGLDKLDEI